MRKEKYRICFLIQGKQHYLKLSSVAEALKNEADITFLIDNNHYYNDSLPSIDEKFHLIKLSDIKYTENLAKTNFLEKKGMLSAFNFIFFKNFQLFFRAINNIFILLAFLIRNFFLLFQNLFNVIGRSIRKLAKQILLGIKGVQHVSKYKMLLLFISYSSKIIRYNNILHSIHNLVTTHKFDLLVMAEANVEHLSEAYIKLCKKVSVPTLIIPYTFCGPSEPAKHYSSIKLFHYQWYYKSFIAGKWIYTYNKQKLIRMPILNILAMQKLKIDPPRPWIQESCSAECIIAESDKIKEHYLNHAIPAKQIKTIGDINHDVMYENLQRKEALKLEICKEIGLSSQKKMILFAIFPDYTLIHRESCEFTNYKEMLMFICDGLAVCEDFELILCLHPSLAVKDYHFLESESVKISTRLTSELLCISDLYVASCSATIKWAISLGLPVINYDVYKFRYGDYLSASGVVNIETKDEFLKTVERIHSDSGYLESLQGAQNQIKEFWGIVDGKFHVRLKNLINELISRNK